MKKTKETDITVKILTWLNKQDGCRVKKRQATTNNIGSPDIYGHVTMVTKTGFKMAFGIEIEVKVPGKTPRPNQMLEIERLKDAGVICFWCDNIDGCIANYNKHIDQIRHELRAAL